MLENILTLFMGFLLMTNGAQAQYHPVVKPGIDVLLEKHLDLIQGKRVGLITNPTGVTSEMESDITALYREPGVELKALFGPEHGVRGETPAGAKVGTYTDPETGIPVYSLYGKTRKPTPHMLDSLDVLLFDIQDVGIRPYTYVYTMAYAMEAAKEKGIPFIVLDRPNPLGGLLVEGPILDETFKSFIGLYPIPYVHGMTIGELAELFNTAYGIGADLTIVKMEGWRRDMLFNDTGLLWIPTSPHVPHADTPFFLATTGGFGELGTISEGVGTPTPFELVGAPWVSATKLARALNAAKLPGVYFRPLSFHQYYAHFSGKTCNGVQIHILNRRRFLPMRTQITILATLYHLYPNAGIFDTDRVKSFYRAMGTDKIRKEIEAGWTVDQILNADKPELLRFLRLRKKFLLY
ncbi:MAG: DUF1343 domain-containing protein [Calditrichaeota bacterium]|nr:DUF1343 domain-containing protein [Calditrichota bacterium]